LKPSPERLDKVIHERVRLAVMAALSARGALTFTELKDLLEVTDGNLSMHTTILEKHELITITKEFAGKKPCTSFSLTDKGKKQFKKYIRDLEGILKSSG
jgi:DNA-binding MarR family transcriptional regulator